MTLKTDRPMTVLFHVQDPDRFKELSDRFFDSLMHGTDLEGAVVTGMSMEDEFTRVERLEEGGDD